MRIVFLLLLFALVHRSPHSLAVATPLPSAGTGERLLSERERGGVALLGCGVAVILLLRRVIKARTSALIREVRLRAEREKDLERENFFVENVIESLPVLFYLHDGHRFQRWNSAFQEVTGLSRDELSRTAPISLICEEDRELTIRKRSEILAVGEAQWEAGVLTKRGVRLHLITGKRMLLDGATYVVGTATDITDRKLAERALQESERRFSKMMENLRLIAIMFDSEDRVTFCNDFLLELTGWQRSEVLGRNWFEMFYPDASESRRTFHEAIDQGSVSLHRERTILTHHGARRVISWNSTVLRNTQGEAVGVASIGEDITDRRQYENALQTITSGVSAATGDAFLQSLVTLLAQALEVEYALISQLDSREAGTMTTVAVCATKETLGNFSYAMTGAPCDRIAAEGTVVIENGLSTLHPDVPFFTERDLQSYAGVPLRNAAGKFLGALTVLSATPFANREVVEAMLNIFAERASAEMERTQAEQALKESEQRYRLLFEKMLNGYAVCEVICGPKGVADFRFLEVNASFEALIGVKRPGIIGMTALQAVPRLEALWLARLGAVALTEQPDQFEGYSAALRKWMRVAAYSPQPGQFAATFSDITQRKLAEHALSETEEHVRQIFDENDDGLILFQMDTFDIIDANCAALELFTLGKAEIKSIKPWSLIGPHDFRKLITTLAKGERDSGFQLSQATCYRSDGSSFVISIRGKILTLRNEYVVFCSVRDITAKVRLEDEMKATQARLIQANKMTSLGMLVSGIAHEINNPNNFISVNSLMMADVWGDVAPILDRYREQHGEFDLGGLPYSEMESVVPRLLSGISEGSSRIASIVNNMRNFVRKEEGGGGGAIDVNRSIESAASLLWHHIHRHTESFSMNLAQGLPPARGSAQQLEQVIINLIMNALQALPGKECGVQISTGIDAEEGMIVISVADEGLGMNKKVRRHLTEPFFSTKIDEGGTGLGLYISSSIVKEHGGSLTFDSSPGKGTTATIKLPVADPGGEVVPSAPGF